MRGFNYGGGSFIKHVFERAITKVRVCVTSVRSHDNCGVSFSLVIIITVNKIRVLYFSGMTLVKSNDIRQFFLSHGAWHVFIIIKYYPSCKLTAIFCMHVTIAHAVEQSDLGAGDLLHPKLHCCCQFGGVS